MSNDLPLGRLNREEALSAIDILRASHPRARAIADHLESAARQRAVPKSVFKQHSRWCNTAGSWAMGVQPARAAAKAMYGFVPKRLVAGDGSMDDEMLERLREYRRRLDH